MATKKSKKRSTSLRGTDTDHSAKSKRVVNFKNFFLKPKSWDDNNLWTSLGKTGLVLLGYIGGKMVDKQFIKSGDKEGYKKFIAPILTAGGGVFLISQENKMMKFIGYGLTAAGAVLAANNALGKDVTNLDLKGFSLGDMLGGKKELPVYKDPIMLKLPPYTPSLPDFSESANAEIPSNTENMNGFEEDMSGADDDEVSGAEYLPFL